MPFHFCASGTKRRSLDSPSFESPLLKEESTEPEKPSAHRPHQRESPTVSSWAPQERYSVSSSPHRGVGDILCGSFGASSVIPNAQWVMVPSQAPLTETQFQQILELWGLSAPRLRLSLLSSSVHPQHCIEEADLFADHVCDVADQVMTMQFGMPVAAAKVLLETDPIEFNRRLRSELVPALPPELRQTLRQTLHEKVEIGSPPKPSNKPRSPVSTSPPSPKLNGDDTNTLLTSTGDLELKRRRVREVLWPYYLGATEDSDGHGTYGKLLQQVNAISVHKSTELLGGVIQAAEHTGAWIVVGDQDSHLLAGNLMLWQAIEASASRRVVLCLDYAQRPKYEANGPVASMFAQMRREGRTVSSVLDGESKLPYIAYHGRIPAHQDSWTTKTATRVQPSTPFFNMPFPAATHYIFCDELPVGGPVPAKFISPGGPMAPDPGDEDMGGPGMDSLDIIPYRVDGALKARLGHLVFGGMSTHSREVETNLKVGTPTVLFSNFGRASLGWARVLRSLFELGSRNANAEEVWRRSRVDGLDNTKVTIDQVMTVTDYFKRAPQVLRTAVVEINALHTSPEAAVNDLCNCFGMELRVPEYGSVATEENAIINAWEHHRCLQHNAARTKRQLDLLRFGGLLLNFVAAMLALMLTVADLSQLALQPPFWVQWLTAEGKLEPIRNVLNGCVLVLPFTSGLFLTIASRMQFRSKWSSLQMASAQIEAEIFKFRMRVGIYASTKGDNFVADEERQARTRFSDKVILIYGRVMDSDGMSSGSSLLGSRQAEFKTVYGDLNHPALAWHISKVVLRGQSLPLTGQTFARTHELVGEGFEDAPAGPPKRARRGRANGAVAVEEVLRRHEVHPDRLVQAMTVQQYMEFRCRPLRAHFAVNAPLLAGRLSVMDNMALVCTLLGVVLAAIGSKEWIPVTAAIIGLSQALIKEDNVQERLVSCNRAVRELGRLETRWHATPAVERKLHSKWEIVETCEQVLLNVMVAWTGLTASDDLYVGASTGKNFGMMPGGAPSITRGLQEPVMPKVARAWAPALPRKLLARLSSASSLISSSGKAPKAMRTLREV